MSQSTLLQLPPQLDSSWSFATTSTSNPAAAAAVTASATTAPLAPPHPISFQSSSSTLGGGPLYHASSSSSASSFVDRAPTPPILHPHPRGPTTPFGSFSSSPSHLPPLQSRPSFDESPPVWNHRLTGNYSPNSTSSSRSPLRTPRELLYTSEPPPQLAEPWQPKPRTWNEQPLFDDLKHQDHGSGNGGSSMQSYSNPIVNMDSMGGASGPSDYMTAPHPGGLGAAFPDLLPPPTQSYGYDSMPLSMPDMDPYRIADRPLVGPTEYAQALQTYYHIQAALEHLRPVDLIGHPAATGQPYRSLVDCASNAVGMLSGRIPAKPLTHLAHHHHHHHQRPMGLAGSEPKRMRMGHFGDKDKPATYCRGCGATETPEWRRGPLGPRTLCNACGLVHMKMMRKKKKAEEKAAAAVASHAAAAKGL